MTPKPEKQEKKEAGCFVCKKTEHESILLSCRKEGEDLWVCARCLPMLIHGAIKNFPLAPAYRRQASPLPQREGEGEGAEKGEKR